MLNQALFATNSIDGRVEDQVQPQKRSIYYWVHCEKVNLMHQKGAHCSSHQEQQKKQNGKYHS
jgi:hypothetical protein